MTTSAWILLAVFLALLGFMAWPLGEALAALCEGRVAAWMQRVEAPLYKLAGVRAGESMHWRSYALALVAFNAVGVLFVYGLQRLQGALPFNAAGLGAVSPDSSFNTAVPARFVPGIQGQGFGQVGRLQDLQLLFGRRGLVAQERAQAEPNQLMVVDQQQRIALGFRSLRPHKIHARILRAGVRGAERELAACPTPKIPFASTREWPSSACARAARPMNGSSAAGCA